MKEFWEDFRKSMVRGALLYIAIPAAAVCGAWLAVSRLGTAFARNEPLEIAPGYKIKLP
jgi:hypothetical protein